MLHSGGPDAAFMLHLNPTKPGRGAPLVGADVKSVAGADDPGSPWAIGAASGGHTAIHPLLGTVEDLAGYHDAATQLGGLPPPPLPARLRAPGAEATLSVRGLGVWCATPARAACRAAEAGAPTAHRGAATPPPAARHRTS